MDKHQQLKAFIESHPQAVSGVVNFDAEKDLLYPFDFTAANTELSAEVIADTEKFSRWVTGKLNEHSCRYGIGGYMEHRTLYGPERAF